MRVFLGAISMAVVLGVVPLRSEGLVDTDVAFLHASQSAKGVELQVAQAHMHEAQKAVRIATERYAKLVAQNVAGHRLGEDAARPITSGLGPGHGEWFMDGASARLGESAASSSVLRPGMVVTLQAHDGKFCVAAPQSRCTSETAEKLQVVASSAGSVALGAVRAGVSQQTCVPAEASFEVVDLGRHSVALKSGNTFCQPSPTTIVCKGKKASPTITPQSTFTVQCVEHCDQGLQTNHIKKDSGIQNQQDGDDFVASEVRVDQQLSEEWHSDTNAFLETWGTTCKGMVMKHHRNHSVVLGCPSDSVGGKDGMGRVVVYTVANHKVRSFTPLILPTNSQNQCSFGGNFSIFGKWLVVPACSGSWMGVRDAFYVLDLTDLDTTKMVLYRPKENLGPWGFWAPKNSFHAKPKHRIHPGGFGPYAVDGDFLAIAATMQDMTFHGRRVAQAGKVHLVDLSRKDGNFVGSFSAGTSDEGSMPLLWGWFGLNLHVHRKKVAVAHTAEKVFGTQWGQRKLLEGAGAIYTYDWPSKKKLRFHARKAGIHAFGESMQSFLDGRLLVVANPEEDTNQNKRSGVVYGLDMEGSGTRMHYYGEGTQNSALYGGAVHVEGTTLMISAPGHKHKNVQGAGAVKVLKLDANLHATPLRDIVPHGPSGRAKCFGGWYNIRESHVCSNLHHCNWNKESKLMKVVGDHAVVASPCERAIYAAENKKGGLLRRFNSGEDSGKFPILSINSNLLVPMPSRGVLLAVDLDDREARGFKVAMRGKAELDRHIKLHRMDESFGSIIRVEGSSVVVGNPMEMVDSVPEAGMIYYRDFSEPVATSCTWPACAEGVTAVSGPEPQPYSRFGTAVAVHNESGFLVATGVKGPAALLNWNNKEGHMKELLVKDSGCANKAETLLVGPSLVVVSRGSSVAVVTQEKNFNLKMGTEEISRLGMITASAQVLIGDTCERIWNPSVKDSKVGDLFQEWRTLDDGQVFKAAVKVALKWDGAPETTPTKGTLQFLNKVKRLGCTTVAESSDIAVNGTALGESCMSASLGKALQSCSPHLLREFEGKLGEDDTDHDLESSSTQCASGQIDVYLVKNMVCATVGQHEGCCVQKLLTPAELSVNQTDIYRTSLKAW